MGKPAARGSYAAAVEASLLSLQPGEQARLAIALGRVALASRAAIVAPREQGRLLC